MIKTGQFINIFNNMCRNRKKKKTIEYKYILELFCKKLVKLHIISTFKIINENSKKKISFDIQNTCFLQNFCKNKKIILSKQELKILLKRDKAYYILSNNLGLKLITPNSILNEGGLLVCKIIL